MDNLDKKLDELLEKAKEPRDEIEQEAINMLSELIEFDNIIKDLKRLAENCTSSHSGISEKHVKKLLKFINKL